MRSRAEPNIARKNAAERCAEHKLFNENFHAGKQNFRSEQNDAGKKDALKHRADGGKDQRGQRVRYGDQREHRQKQIEECREHKFVKPEHGDIRN